MDGSICSEAWSDVRVCHCQRALPTRGRPRGTDQAAAIFLTHTYLNTHSASTRDWGRAVRLIGEASFFFFKLRFLLLCSRWMDLYPGLCASPIWTPSGVCASVWGLDGWKIGPSVSEGAFVSCSTRGSVMKGESRGRRDTLMMLILGLSHRWYEWFLFGWSSSRTPGVLLSSFQLFIYLPSLLPDPHHTHTHYIQPNSTLTLAFWLPC